MALASLVRQQIAALPMGPEVPRGLIDHHTDPSVDVYKDPVYNVTLVKFGFKDLSHEQATGELFQWYPSLYPITHFVSLDGRNFQQLFCSWGSIEAQSGGAGSSLGNVFYWAHGLTHPLIGRFGQTDATWLYPKRMQSPLRSTLQLFTKDSVAVTLPMGATYVFSRLKGELNKVLGDDIHFFYTPACYDPKTLIHFHDGSELLLARKFPCGIELKDSFQVFLREADGCVKTPTMNCVTDDGGIEGFRQIEKIETSHGTFYDTKKIIRGQRAWTWVKPDGSLLTGRYQKGANLRGCFVAWGLDGGEIPLASWRELEDLWAANDLVPDVFTLTEPIPIPQVTD